MDVRQVLQTSGKNKEIEMKGRRMTILPTCNVPFEYLLEENWRSCHGNDPKAEYSSIGHFRFVWRINQLVDGQTIGLYVKHPERVFTTSQSFLAKCEIWWGGPRSGEKLIFLQHPLVEQQTLWQAVYLLELYQQGIPAEVPLAIIELPDGRSELVTHDVVTFPYDRCFSDDKISRKVGQIGFIAEDLAGHNLVTTSNNLSAIIDVNRWLWPPYTDDWRRELTGYIKAEVAKYEG